MTRASWFVLEQALWRAGRSGEAVLRAELKLPPTTASTATTVGRQGVPEIQAYDRVLFPDLVDEWGQRRPLVGFLNLSSGTRTLMDVEAIEPVLDAWLDAGSAPVYVGFGSMHIDNPDAVVGAITYAAGQLGMRVLVAMGWSDLDIRSDDRVMIVRAVDHEKVLPRCRAAVHHGGAGSTAASLRAGIATLVCWIGADQPLWGARIEHLGAGISVRLADMSANSWRSALARVLSTECEATAKRMSKDMTSAENAVAHSADIAESVVVRRRVTG
ncbi:glycosyltransferase [Rhodococcus sp. 27YEA15]|uniref:glycosyltransferase n=1 Tax=Rhodococcus sp. 27YEA15 TaxID=3156259 RepID=UPI003C7C6F51